MKYEITMNKATDRVDFLFRRFSPQKKLEMIEKLGPADLTSISTATFERIVKEAGRKMYKSRNKRLFISKDRQRGNSWNSTIEALEYIKHKLYLDVYFQFSNTDTNTSVELSKFLGHGAFTGSVVRGDRYGNDRHYYFTYDEGSKQRVLRSILKEYVYTKYNDKLCVTD